MVVRVERRRASSGDARGVPDSPRRAISLPHGLLSPRRPAAASPRVASASAGNEAEAEAAGGGGLLGGLVNRVWRGVGGRRASGGSSLLAQPRRIVPGAEGDDGRAAIDGALHQVILTPSQVFTLPDGTKHTNDDCPAGAVLRNGQTLIWHSNNQDQGETNGNGNGLPHRGFGGAAGGWQVCFSQ